MALSDIFNFTEFLSEADCYCIFTLGRRYLLQRNLEIFCRMVDVFVLIPFTTQSTGYVFSQYLACLDMLKTASALGHSQDWAQFFNLISQSGWELPQLWQNVIRILVALVFLQMGFLIKKRCSLSETAAWLLMMAMIYLILFNPGLKIMII